MNRNYRKNLPKLTQKPKEIIRAIYIIPDKAYNGFWGKNGFKSYDFIFEGNLSKNIGWCHWEGDVIHLVNDKELMLNIDCKTENDYIRIFTPAKNGLNISDMIISDLTIGVKED